MEDLSRVEEVTFDTHSAVVKTNVFRLMSLVRETQCEMEVVKPVLDELEVMRLCCSFGMMSSVHANDFNYRVLHAREFDDDFVRFLRFDLLENSCPGYVKLKGLFGKQAQVLDALLDMQVCNKESIVSLAKENEGIYCVKITTDPSEDQSSDQEKIDGLVVFSWIRDELFEPQGLRDTPAFVLRFLTGLTPNIVCCTSLSDMEQIKMSMASLDDKVDNELSSYSVSFNVDKQEDQSDSTKCMAVSSIDLNNIPDGCSKICLIKGSYSAVAITNTMNSAIRTEPFNRTFRYNTRESFAEWLKAESEHFRIDLNRTIVRSVKLCQNILQEFEMWPEDEMNAYRDAHEKEQREHFDAEEKCLKAEIASEKAVADKISTELFRLRAAGISDAEADAASQTAFTTYSTFQEWLKSTCSWKIDNKITLSLEAPILLREAAAGLFDLYSCGHESELKGIIEMCATSSKADLLKSIKQRKKVKKSSALKKVVVDGEAQIEMWHSFLKTTAGHVETLRTKWWLALESVLAAISEARLKNLKSEEKYAKTAWYDDQKVVIESKFDELRKLLISRNGLLLCVSAHPRGRGVVRCEGTREMHSLPTVFHDIVKLNTPSTKLKSGSQEYLGRLIEETDTKHVAIFTVKVRSAVLICTGKERMAAKLIHFPVTEDPRRPTRANVRLIRTFGQFASVCDYDARNRMLTFLAKDSVGIYKFDESFKQLDLMKTVDLDVRSTLRDLPFTDVLVIDSTVYVTDSSGSTQGIDIHNDQTSNVMSVHTGTERDVSHSRLMELADTLVIGVVSCAANKDGSFEGNLECSARDDHRALPTLPLGVKFLTDKVSVQCIDDKVLVLDPLAQKVYVFSIQVTIRSDSYRLRQSGSTWSKSDEPGTSNADCPRKQHWLYTLYHVFEKFPVRGSLDCEPPLLVSILIACPGVDRPTTALECFHDYLSLLMSDLMALNKPLYGLDLTEGLAVTHSLYGVALQSKSVKSFFQTLITFLPVQICRAEGNALIVLHDGMDAALDEFDVENQAWGAADIAESIRFGLLSPLLCAWRGRCVVITSMGKQSTGKSYFLNHLTGSSFAIAGNRCTDGAWMTLRIMKDILLVVLDFEGLGSFERTDQEDVFLSVLNASLSMFTIFRMEMRFDKDIDGLFTKFQKGINLLKNDKRLFQGTLYMSVKDVNPNDRHGVLAEFQRKCQKLLTANREQNFLTEMYSGKLRINCSPPLGTMGYYASLRHAQQLITEVINDPESLRGFKSGNSFHDCIRLVLAKISILDWTAVDKSSQRLEMNELHRKLPGAIRTGCLIPLEAQMKTENLPQCLKDPLFHDESVVGMLTFDQLSRDYPSVSKSWAIVNQNVNFDTINDEDIDFGPSVCNHAPLGADSIHFTLLSLFQRYLVLTAKGILEKICDEDYAEFDAMLSFLVRRRKTKVILWVKQFLGAERFSDEWEQIEQTYFLPFETQFRRCLHSCAKCQLQCMRSVCHLFNEEHDCGMSHVCRGLCSYCVQKYQPGKEMPRCVGKAGHEGKCDCARGDHTCGAECSLIGASNCGELCVLLQGHDGNHRCSVKQHACGAACNATNCGGKCILNAEHCHTVHKCAEIQCNHMCEMDSCKERCSTANHFHDQPGMWAKFATENEQPSIEVTVGTGTGGIIHLCSSRHPCPAECEAEGICTKVVQVSMGEFPGKCGSFNYELKQMVAVRNKCAIVLQQGKTHHDGSRHSCEKRLLDGTKSIHGCGVKCSACEYYCDKVVGHPDEHSAAHGNMRNMHFVAQDKDRTIVWEDRKYKVGERGLAEMCNMFCSTAGRGHVHYLKCDKVSTTCVYSGLQDQRRHCEVELNPQPQYEVDEVIHERYWKTMGWEDPCRSATERALFNKCPYLCDAREHKADSPSYCDLDVWHASASSRSFGEQRGFAYVNGHRFVCSHTSGTGKLHHVFVLDCSGSMRGLPWQQLLQGVRGYIQSRLSSGATEDVVSVVTFGDRGIIEYERWPISTCLSQIIEFHGGGTFYSNGLRQANALLSRTQLTVYKPVLIFFTDGRPADRLKGPRMASDIRARYAKFGLQSFIVGYGRASDVGIRDLANRLRGTVRQTLDARDLEETLRSISLSLGACAGLIHDSSHAP